MDESQTFGIILCNTVYRTTGQVWFSEGDAEPPRYVVTRVPGGKYRCSSSSTSVVQSLQVRTLQLLRGFEQGSQKISVRATGHHYY